MFKSSIRICDIMAKQPRSLITGINGFVGSYLAELLVKRGHKVYGTLKKKSDLGNVSRLSRKITLIEADLRHKKILLSAIKRVRPDYIFHLAAQSSASISTHSPKETFDINFFGTLNLLDAVRKSKLDPVIQIACSSEEYGLVYPNEVPIKETNPLRPLNPYAVSKIGADFLGYQYFKSYGLKIIRTRAFNHEGPRRGKEFVTSSFAKQIVEIEKGLREPMIFVGNLSPKRDFTDVRDVVKAYYLAVKKGEYGEVYNICSGKAWSIREVLEYMLSLSKVKHINIKEDKKKVRVFDVPVLVGENSKFVKRTGWKPKIDFKKTLSDILEYWRETRLAVERMP
jgi:GDP-4-dehydro-6-deoxy-D-mannose reductase